MSRNAAARTSDTPPYENKGKPCCPLRAFSLKRHSLVAQLALLLTLLLAAACSNDGREDSFTCPTSASDETTFGGVLLRANLDPFAGSGYYSDVWAENNTAFVGSYAGFGVGIYNISNPDAPSLITQYTAGPYNFNDVKTENGIGYFGSQTGAGVHIVDVSDPASPGLLAVIDADTGGVNDVHNVFLYNSLLYIVQDTPSALITIFDVTIPGSPSFVRQFSTNSQNTVHDITVVNGILAASTFSGVTELFNVSAVSTILAPDFLGTVETGINSHSTWISEDGALLASAREISNGDIRLYDISNPTNPLLLSTIGPAQIGVAGTSPHNPVISGNLLYVSWYRAGLQVFDISNPALPVRLGAFDTFIDDTDASCALGGNWGVYPFLGPDRILLSDLNSGLFIVDVQPALP